MARAGSRPLARGEVREKLDLVVETSGEVGAVHAGEVLAETEQGHDAPGIDLGLRRAQEHAAMLRGKRRAAHRRCRRRRRSRASRRRRSAPGRARSPARSPRHRRCRAASGTTRAAAVRRSAERRVVGDADAQALQRIGDGARDARVVVGQRAVEVEQQASGRAAVIEAAVAQEPDPVVDERALLSRFPAQAIAAACERGWNTPLNSVDVVARHGRRRT